MSQPTTPTLKGIIERMVANVARPADPMPRALIPSQPSQQYGNVEPFAAFAAAPAPKSAPAAVVCQELVAAPAPPEQFAALSPSKQFVAAAPPKQFSAPSPPKQFAAPAPPEQFAALSPSKQFVAAAPPKQFSAPSPPKQFAAPAPLEQFAALSPSKQFAAAAPPKQSASPAPLKQFASPTPSKQFASPAPPKQSGDDFWANMGFGARVADAQKQPELGHSGGAAEKSSAPSEELPPGGKFYDIRICTPTLGVMFFKPHELTDSLFLHTDKSIVEALKDRPVVAYIVEGTSARSAGVELGHVLLKVNGIDIKDPKEASRLIKEGTRPLSLLFYVPDTNVVIAEGEHMVKYDTRETTAPGSAKDWKPKYVVIGGIIAQPWMMNMYRSKSEYDIAVIDSQARRPVSVKVKQFSLQGARIQNDWQGPQMVKYKNTLHPWKYIVILKGEQNPIKISSPDLIQLRPVHEGIRRMLESQEDVPDKTEVEISTRSVAGTETTGYEADIEEKTPLFIPAVRTVDLGMETPGHRYEADVEGKDAPEVEESQPEPSDPGDSSGTVNEKAKVAPYAQVDESASIHSEINSMPVAIAETGSHEPLAGPRPQVTAKPDDSVSTCATRDDETGSMAAPRRPSRVPSAHAAAESDESRIEAEEHAIASVSMASVSSVVVATREGETGSVAPSVRKVSRRKAPTKQHSDFEYYGPAAKRKRRENAPQKDDDSASAPAAEDGVDAQEIAEVFPSIPPSTTAQEHDASLGDTRSYVAVEAATEPCATPRPTRGNREKEDYDEDEAASVPRPSRSTTRGRTASSLRTRSLDASVEDSTTEGKARATRKSRKRKSRKTKGVLVKAKDKYEGDRIAKEFDEGIFFGTIRKFWVDEENKALWTVTYDDKDWEDLSENELVEVLDLYSTHKAKDTIDLEEGRLEFGVETAFDLTGPRQGDTVDSDDEDDASFDEDIANKVRRVIPIDDDYYDAEEASLAEDYETARDENSAMDWEHVSDENQAPQSTKPRLGVTLAFIEGPLQGESFSLVKKQMETAVLGSNPTCKKGEYKFALGGDDTVDENHVKIVLRAHKYLQAVLVTDLKSSNGTLVNNKPVIGKDHKVYINDTIHIGESTIKISPLANEEASHKTGVAKRPTVVRARAGDLVSPLHEEPTRNVPTGPGIRILFMQGPHKDKTMVLQKGAIEKVVLGSHPKSKAGDTRLLDADTSTDASHVRLELNISKNYCAVIATDLKSFSGTFVNSKRIGKDQKVFINDVIRIGATVMKVKPL